MINASIALIILYLVVIFGMGGYKQLVKFGLLFIMAVLVFLPISKMILIGIVEFFHHPSIKYFRRKNKEAAKKEEDEFMKKSIVEMRQEIREAEEKRWQQRKVGMFKTLALFATLIVYQQVIGEQAYLFWCFFFVKAPSCIETIALLAISLVKTENMHDAIPGVMAFLVFVIGVFALVATIIVEAIFFMHAFQSGELAVSQGWLRIIIIASIIVITIWMHVDIPNMWKRKKK